MWTFFDYRILYVFFSSTVLYLDTTNLLPPRQMD